MFHCNAACICLGICMLLYWWYIWYMILHVYMAYAFTNNIICVCGMHIYTCIIGTFDRCVTILSHVALGPHTQIGPHQTKTNSYTYESERYWCKLWISYDDSSIYIWYIIMGKYIRVDLVSESMHSILCTFCWNIRSMHSFDWIALCVGSRKIRWWWLKMCQWDSVPCELMWSRNGKKAWSWMRASPA